MKHFLLKTVLLLFALIVGSSAWATDVTYTLTISSSDFNTTSYAANNNEKTSNAVCTTDNTKTYQVKWTSNQVMKNSSNMQWQKNSGYIYNSTDLGTINSVTVNSSAGSFTTYYGTEEQPSSGSAGSGKGYFKTKVGNATGTTSSIVISFTVSEGGGSSTPSISANPTSLSTFTYVVGNGPSAAKTVSVSGSNLTENISLSLGESSNYEMCLTENGSYTNSLSLTPTTGTVSATNVYVRLKSGLTAGDKDGSITLTSTGATNATVSLSGSVTTLGVTYDGNTAGSGTAPTDATAYAYNAEVTVLGNTGSLAKTGHSFGGWNTQDNGEGTNYTAGDKFNITANTTLYAKWVINSHTVTLPATDAFGEYTMNKTNDVAYGTEVTLTYTPASGYENYVATWSVNGTPISGNKFNMPDAAVTVTVSLNEVFDMTLTNKNIYDAGDGATGYGTKTITDSNGKTWNAYAIKNQHSNNTSSYHYLQIRSYNNSTAYYIQVPEYGRKITKLEMTVSGASAPKGNGGNTATLFFSASNSTSATGTGVAYGSGDSKVTIDCSELNLNTGYITAGGAVRIWDVKVTYDPIRLNGSGYATYAGLTPIDYSDDSKFSAWAITSISGDAITFSQITGSVPAGTGVLLKGTPGQAVEPVVAASGTDISGTNKLVGTTTPTPVAAGAVYGLSGNQFVKSSADGNIPAGRAYIPASAISSSVKSLNFIFDDATGISTLERVVLDNDAWYDLQGRRVAQPTKGIYIHNGKKIFVK